MCACVRVCHCVILYCIHSQYNNATTNNHIVKLIVHWRRQRRGLEHGGGVSSQVIEGGSEARVDVGFTHSHRYLPARSLKCNARSLAHSLPSLFPLHRLSLPPIVLRSGFSCGPIFFCSFPWYSRWYRTMVVATTRGKLRMTILSLSEGGGG